MGRFHKTYAVSGDTDKCIGYIERYLLNRGYRSSEAYYGRRMFIACDSSLPTILGADNNMRFISVDRQDELIVIEAWILNAYAVANDRGWRNPAFISKLDRNEIDPSEDATRFKARKKDLLVVLEDIVAIIEDYNRSGTVSSAMALPSGFCYSSECEDLADYIKTIAPPSITGCIIRQSVFIYALAFFSVVAAITTSSWSDILQIALIVVLTLVVHIRKSTVFATALFVLCIGEVLLPFLFMSSSNFVTWFMLVDAYLMTNTFKNAARMYRQSLLSLE